jgi:hypothetical protein
MMDHCQMKGTHLLFIHFPDMLAINQTKQKFTQKGEISSVRNFPHGIIRITWAELVTTLSQWQLINIWLVTKK